jgi:DNA-binding Lrp family transcriptional regulator
MWLTKNEKKVLKLIIDNAKLSDTSIANQLNISSQAIGKIRRKLEGTIIESYTLNLNYSKLGINLFAIALAKITAKGLDKGELEVEKTLLDAPNIIQIFRLPHGNFTHAMLYGFRNVNELDDFFHSQKQKQELHNFLENKELFTFSNYSLIKNNPIQLFNKMIDEFGTNNSKNNFKEINNFKQRL